MATTRPVFNNEGMRPAVGSEFLISRHLPKKVQEQFIYACVINMNGMPRFTVEDDSESSGFRGKRIKDLLSSPDKCFRPVDPKIGPDGAIWFGDWCNALIGHMQYSQRDPNRDKRHGRVYRLVNKNEKLLTPVSQHQQSIDNLLQQLTSYELRTRYRARRELWSRNAADVIPALKRWVEGLSADDVEFERNLCEALWVQENFHLVDPALIEKLVAAKDYRARAAAVHVVGNEHRYFENALEILKRAVQDDSYRVRLEAIRGLSFLEDIEAARQVLKAIEKPVDYWIRYTMKHAMMAMKPVWQPAQLKGQFANTFNEAENKWFADYLESLGPSSKAIPHIQTIADASKSSAEHDSAVAALAKIRGNRNNGRRVFRRVCTSCHEVDGRGINFGPDLKTIKKRIRERARFGESIIYSIFEPNRDIADEYKTTKLSDRLKVKCLPDSSKNRTDSEWVMRLAGDKVMFRFPYR